MPPFGTHHTKMFIVFYSAAVRVVITTANFIEKDWIAMTQAVWFQDFPLRSADSPALTVFGGVRMLVYVSV